MALDPYSGGLTPQAHTELVSPAKGSEAGGIVTAIAGGLAFVVAIIWATTGSQAIGFSLGIGALVCVGIGAFLIRRAQAETNAWGDFEFHFSQWGLPLGSNSVVTVIRRSKIAIPNATGIQLATSIRCQEVVKYQVGTDTKTERNNVVIDHLQLIGSIEDNAFIGLLDLEIPVDRGGPSLDLDHNRIHWTLQVQPGQLSTMQKAMTFDIAVLPELDGRHRRIVDGPAPPSLPPYDA